MSDSRAYTVTALILRLRDYGEGHKMITLFSREEGKILAVAKGVRKPRARLAGALQHFALAEVHLAMGRRFDVITQVRVLNAYYGLRASIEAFAYANYFAELLDESLEERQQKPALFDLMTDALTRLAAGEPPDLLARYVEISLIAVLGYLPQLTQCAHCGVGLAFTGADGRPVWPQWLGFSAAQGGALCTDCLPHVPGSRRIAAGVVQLAQRLLTRGPVGIAEMPLSDRLRRELEHTLRDYLEYRLEKRLHSTQFLRELTDAPTTQDDDAYPVEPPAGNAL